MILPLVEEVTNYYQGPYLENVIIIGVQHILETTHAMFRSLYRLGLQPKNVFLIGKCYSTCKDVYDEMIADGIDIDPCSLTYSSHTSFDEDFRKNLENFICKRISKLKNPKIEKIIILDDGGKCIELIQTKMDKFRPLIAIEQTSSGYEAIKDIALDFPVINVAKSKTKLQLESPMIAKAAVDRLLISLQNAELNPKKALIIGTGAIGKAVKNKLHESGFLTETFDIKNAKRDLADALKDHTLILGCTGQTSIPKEYHSLLNRQTVLASVSSSDREFDAVHLRKKIASSKNCHLDLLINDILLIRNGFPVNFDGDRENVEPKFIQLTIALMTAGILQGVEQDLLTSPGVIALKPQLTDFIEDTFMHLLQTNQI